MLAGALAACGGGFFEDEEEAVKQDAATTLTAPPATPAPAPQTRAPRLDRRGLQLTFSDDFTTLTSDFSARMPVNGKWQTWLSLGGRDNFYSRTLHHAKGEEQQYYVDQYILDKLCTNVPGYRKYDPFSLADGPDGKVLRITARRMEQAMVSTLRDKLGIAQRLPSYDSTKFFSSGVISTYEGFKQTYGVFEARIRTSALAGSWPAFWMMNADRGYSYWPPEIDIVDNFPQKNAFDRWILGGVITRDGKGYGPKDEGMPGKRMPFPVRDVWRTFGVDWGPKEIVYYCDDVEYYRAPTPATFHENMFLMLNLAVVGQDSTWADKPLANTDVITLDIDWVRVWKRTGV